MQKNINDDNANSIINYIKGIFIDAVTDHDNTLVASVIETGQRFIEDWLSLTNELLTYVLNDKHLYNPVIIKQLINAGADVNSTPQNGDTALHFAIKRERINKSFISYLLIKGANPNIKNNNGESAYSYLLSMKTYTKDQLLQKFELAKVFIEYGANVTETTPTGSNILHLVVNEIFPGDVDFVKFLLDKGININLTDHNGYPPIMFTHKSEVDILLINKGANLIKMAENTLTQSMHYFMISINIM